LVIFDNT